MPEPFGPQDIGDSCEVEIRRERVDTSIVIRPTQVRPLKGGLLASARRCADAYDGKGSTKELKRALHHSEYEGSSGDRANEGTLGGCPLSRNGVPNGNESWREATVQSMSIVSQPPAVAGDTQPSNTGATEARRIAPTELRRTRPEMALGEGVAGARGFSPALCCARRLLIDP